MKQNSHELAKKRPSPQSERWLRERLRRSQEIQRRIREAAAAEREKRRA